MDVNGVELSKQRVYTMVHGQDKILCSSIGGTDAWL